MNTNEAEPTQKIARVTASGDKHARTDGKPHRWYLSRNGKPFLTFDTKDQAMAAIFADALNVYHKTDLFPRELAEQREKLLMALQDMVGVHSCVLLQHGSTAHCGICEWCRACDTIDRIKGRKGD